MSRAGISDFNWPIAAPGASDLSKSILKNGSAHSTTMSTGAFVNLTSSAKCPVSTDVSSPDKTIYVTEASSFAAVSTSTASLTYQTKPLDFHAPSTSSMTPATASTISAVVFELYTPSADPSVSVQAEVSPINLDSGSGPNSSPPHIHNPSVSSSSSGAKIAGIIGGSVALALIFGLVLTLWRVRRSRRITDSGSGAAVDIEAALEVKRQRAQHLGLDRWSRRDTEANLERFKKLKDDAAAKKAVEKKIAIVAEVEGEAIVVGEEDQDMQTQHERTRRRPSGLTMHPPTPVETEYKGCDGNCASQAL